MPGVAFDKMDSLIDICFNSFSAMQASFVNRMPVKDCIICSLLSSVNSRFKRSVAYLSELPVTIQKSLYCFDNPRNHVYSNCFVRQVTINSFVLPGNSCSTVLNKGSV